MKNFIYSIIISIVSLHAVRAQTMLKAEQINTSIIADYIKKANYNVLEVTPKFIKISNSTNSVLYLDMDSVNHKYLFFNVAIAVKNNMNRDSIDQLVYDINSLNMIKCEYYPSDNSIEFKYYYWITNGLCIETLTDAINEFFLYQGDAYNMDKQKILNYSTQ